MSATTSSTVEIRTSDGVTNAYVTRPQGGANVPGVLFYCDAFGVRDTLRRMADRLASHGYHVLLPNLFYRVGPFAPFDVKTAFSTPKETERVMSLIKSLDDASAMRDTGAYLDHLSSSADTVGEPGLLGYCMGGGLAMSAGCNYADRVGAIASFHGGGFLVDPDSPAIIAQKLRAPTYVGVAETDRRHTPAVTKALEVAFTRAGVPHTVDTYPAASHGFAVPDHAVYDEAAAERHWEALLAFFGTYLKSNGNEES